MLCRKIDGLFVASCNTQKFTWCSTMFYDGAGSVWHIAKIPEISPDNMKTPENLQPK